VYSATKRCCSVEVRFENCFRALLLLGRYLGLRDIFVPPFLLFSRLSFYSKYQTLVEDGQPFNWDQYSLDPDHLFALQRLVSMAEEEQVLLTDHDAAEGEDFDEYAELDDSRYQVEPSPAPGDLATLDTLRMDIINGLSTRRVWPSSPFSDPFLGNHTFLFCP